MLDSAQRLKIINDIVNSNSIKKEMLINEVINYTEYVHLVEIETESYIYFEGFDWVFDSKINCVVDKNIINSILSKV